MDDGIDSSMDTGADAGGEIVEAPEDSATTEYSSEDIAELAAAAQEVLDAPAEELPAEEAEVAAEPEPEPEPDVAVVESAPTVVGSTVTDATPAAAKSGCATLLIGLGLIVALVVLVLAV